MPTQQQSHSILLIDPFKNLLNAYRVILEAENYCVETATSVKELYQCLLRECYSVVVTEYFPPPEETCLALSEIKKRAPETHIVMVTNASLDDATYGQLFDLGLDDMIVKPYSAAKVLVHIKKGLRQRSMALEMQALQGQSLLDPTTEQIIFNSTHFRKCFRQELKRAKRHKHPVSLLVIGLPTSEELGDHYGGFCTELARVLRTHVREEDIMGRENGGFGILLPETDQAGAQALTKRISSLVHAHPMFQSDVVLRSAVGSLSYQAFTSPDAPKSLRPISDEVGGEYPRR
jgi:diguanylate cyclase (GGDEF)-like protein